MGISTLISTTTADNSASLAITSGIDSTYDEYMLVGINIDHATSTTPHTFQGSIDGGSNYNVAITSSAFADYHYENDAAYGLEYWASSDLAQGTGYHRIAPAHDTDADQCASFILHLFSPASTTYVTHFYAYGLAAGQHPSSYNMRIAGYFNSTDNIDALSFKASSGNIVSGSIQLYGIA